MANYQQALNLFNNPQHLALLSRLQRGIEKEGLRCSPRGIISQKPHPQGLGSALMHPSITTDYSEALLEFITPVFTSAHEAHAYLNIAHRFACKQLDDELIWPSSMPCILQGEMSIPIAYYGTSNLGQLKHIYRHGLWHRYGRTMQTISGIHYNFSLPADIWPLLQANDEHGSQYSAQSYISARYFGLIRNFRRYSWLLLYLFGASPAVCASFLAGRDHKLERFSNDTLYAPYATSLRMSDLGYQNNAQSDLMVCHNSLDNYIRTLGNAIGAPVAAYEEIGVQDAEGHYKQLNTSLLQIENEYYSDIRPKRVARNGEKPLQALDKYGVEYIEVRCTDVNPFMPVGIDVPQMHFMDLFLTWCLLQPSAAIDEDEYWRIKRNQQATVMEGRRPGLMLEQRDGNVSLQSWGLHLLDEMKELAAMMDNASGQSFHLDSLGQQHLKLADSRLTPSAQVLQQLQEKNIGFADLTLQQALQHRKTLSIDLGHQVYRQWQQLARDSIAEQKALESSDDQPFAAYLAHYLQR